MIDTLPRDKYPAEQPGGEPRIPRFRQVALHCQLSYGSNLVWASAILSLQLLIQDDIMVHYAHVPRFIIQSINFSLFFVSVKTTLPQPPPTQAIKQVLDSHSESYP